MSHRILPLTFLTLLVFVAACNPAYPPAQGVECRVGVVGDSLGVGTSATLPEELDRVGCSREFSHVRVSMPTAEGTAILKDQSLEDIDILVVSLGTNDYYRADRFGDLIDQLMTAARGKRVVWNNIGGTIANRIDLNNALTGASFRWDELWIHDWAAVTDAQPELLAADGIHLTQDGYTIRAASIADFLRSG